MKNKVIIFSDNQNLIAETLMKVEKSLLNRGFFDFSFFSSSSLNETIDMCKKAKIENDCSVIVCDNKLMDDIVEKCKENDDDLSLLEEQAIVLKQTTTFRKMLFVPIEIEVDKFLDDFLEAKEVFSCSVFGKNRSFCLQIFENIKEHEVNFDYKIITISSFLHIIYYSKFIVEDILVDKFGENLFCQSNCSLQDCCCEILKNNNLTLSVADCLTSGKLSERLAQLENDEKIQVKENFILNDDDAFEMVDIEKSFLDEHGIVSKETVFVVAKNLLKKSNADISISIVGFDCDAGRCFVAVGNKEEIHVFSSVFYGKRQERFENCVEFSLFRLLKFLKEKY